MTYFWNVLETYGAAPAVIENGQPISYTDLAALADEMVSVLPPEPQLVLVMAANSAHVIAGMLGIWRHGSTVLLCDPEDNAQRERLDAAYKASFVLDGGEGGAVQLRRLRNAPPQLHEDLRLLISTSGSSGNTKAVRLSAHNIDSNARQIASYLKLSGQDRALMTLSVHYCYGLSVVNSHLMAGGSLITGRADVSQPDFMACLERSGATSFAGVPYTFEVLARRGFLEAEFPQLRYVTQAGGRLDPQLVSQFGAHAKRAGYAFFVMYGATESTSRMAYLPPDQLEDTPQAIGIPIPGGEIALVDDTGQNVPDGTEGEIRYTGPNVMMGYAESAGELALGKTVQHLMTGDMAQRLNNGLIQITGRKSRFAKIFGVRLNLDQVEAGLAVEGTPVLSVSDDRYLFLISTNEKHVPNVLHVAERFGLPPSNVLLQQIDAPPLLASGKIDYRRLQREAIARQFASATERNAVGDTAAQLRGLFETHFPGQKLAMTASFNQLAGDSLTYVQVSLGIEEILGTLPDHWEEMSLETLAQLDRGFTTWLSWVDPTVLIRVIAPLLVVLNHAGHPYLRGGAAALFIVVGYNFARFQLTEIISGRWQKAALSILLFLLIPYWIVLIGMPILKGAPISWPYVFLYGNNYYPGQRTQPFGTWFVQAAIQSVLLICLPLLIPAVRRWAQDRVTIYVILVVLFGFFSRIVLDPVLHETIFTTGRCQRISCNFWLFSAGMGIAMLTTFHWRLALSLATIVMGFATFPDAPSRGVIIAVSVLPLIWVKRLPVPRVLTGVVSTLAAASLWIYMLHPRGRIVDWSAALPVDIVRVGSGVLFGIIAWKIYTLALNYLHILKQKYANRAERTFVP